MWFVLLGQTQFIMFIDYLIRYLKGLTFWRTALLFLLGIEEFPREDWDGI